MSRVPRIPPELIHNILVHLVPSWEWGDPFLSWKEMREQKPARADAFWFLNLRLVNRNFNWIVLDLFVDVMVNRSLMPDALCDDDPETESMMAMGRRILSHLVSSFAGDHCSEKAARGVKFESPHRLVNMIIQIGQRAAALFSDPCLENGEDLREAYTKGAIATLIGLEGTDLLVFINRPYQAESDNEEVDYDGDEDAESAVLMVAAYLGRRDHLERSLAMGSGRDINFHCVKKHIWPPLMAACLAGRLDMVKFLLEKGADLHFRSAADNLRSSVGIMEIAARTGHAYIMDFLIQNNVSAVCDSANCESLNCDGNRYTPLAIAAGGRHISTIQLLLRSLGIDLIGTYRLKYSALFLAIKRGYGDVLDELLKRKDLDVNVTDTINEARDVSALAVAAGLAREKIFMTLFEHPGIDRELPSVLKAAIEGGNLNIIKKIVEEAPGSLEKIRKVMPGETALCKAAADGTVETVRYLLTVDEQAIRKGDLYRRTPLHRAILSEALENIQVLLEHPAMDQTCFAMPNRRGHTCLHQAAESRNPHIVQILLERPIPDINARDDMGRTPFAAAAFYGAVGMFKTLLAREDVMKDSLDNCGENPFMNATATGAVEIMDIFFQLPLPGSEIWRRNKKNRTALQLAVERDRNHAVKRLLDPDIGATKEIIRDALRDAEALFASWIGEHEALWGPQEQWEAWELGMRKEKKEIIKILSDALELHRNPAP